MAKKVKKHPNHEHPKFQDRPRPELYRGDTIEWEFHKHGGIALHAKKKDEWVATVAMYPYFDYMCEWSAMIVEITEAGWQDLIVENTDYDSGIDWLCSVMLGSHAGIIYNDDPPVANLQPKGK